MPPKFREYKLQIDTFLDAFLDKHVQSLSRVNPMGNGAVEGPRVFVTQGKTVRGGFVLWAYEAFGGTDIESILPAAGAIELFHTGLLIHDDIMDHDRMRRGINAMHVQYENILKNNGNGVRDFGTGMATCVGDLAFFLGSQCLSALPDPTNHRNVSQLVFEELSNVTVAQMSDVQNGYTNARVAADEILHLYLYKTGKYTCSMPLSVGAVLAGVSEESITALTELGDSLGILFQIQDDMLNLFGDSGVSGKPIGSDFRESKKTLPYVFMMQEITDPERKMLDSTQGSERVDLLYSFFEKHDIAGMLQRKKNELSKAIMKLIKEQNISLVYRKELAVLAEFFMNRSK